MGRRRGRRFRKRLPNGQRQAGNTAQGPAAAQHGDSLVDGSEYDQADLTGQQALPVDPEGGIQGSGVRNARDEYGLSQIRSARMINRAIREGWGEKSRPWNLGVKSSDLAKAEKQDGGLDLQQVLELAVYNGALSKDPRVQQIAVRSGVAMQGQNLSDEHHRERMDFHERALQLRMPGLAAGGLGAAAAAAASASVNVHLNTGGAPGVGEPMQAGVGIAIYLPWNGRDPMPGGAMMPIDGLTIDGDASQLAGDSVDDLGNDLEAIE